MSSILVPVDFSDVTDRVLEHAARAAQHEGAPLLLLHVAPMDPEYVGYRVGPQDERDSIAAELHDERDQLHAIAARLTDEGVVTEALVVMGGTVERILDEAHKRNVSLIVMGSHGHGRLYNLIVGSVAEGVLRKAPCAVLIVPAREET